MPRSRATRFRCTVGQAMVEFAMILPLVTLLVLLGLDFSRVMHDRLILVDAARAGAQTAAVTPAPPFANVAAAVVAEAPDLAIQGDAAHIQVAYPGDGTAQITVEYGFQAVTPLISRTWGGGPLTVTVSASWPLRPVGVAPTPLATPSAQPTVTATVMPTATPSNTPAPTATATATPSAPTPTPLPGCDYAIRQPLQQGQGYYVVIDIPASTRTIAITFRAPGTTGAASIYLYAGGSAFAGAPNPPITMPPPAGSIASATASGNTATLRANVLVGQRTYSVYFYATGNTNGNSVRQSIGCSTEQNGGGGGNNGNGG
jgi:Flp pilus assembly protein TadG